jgi:hypothetical protein
MFFPSKIVTKLNFTIFNHDAALTLVLIKTKQNFSCFENSSFPQEKSTKKTRARF